MLQNEEKANTPESEERRILLKYKDKIIPITPIIKNNNHDFVPI